MQYLTRVFTQINDFLRTLSVGKKIAMVMIALGIVSGMAILFLWAENTTYVTLMTNLGGEDSTNIIRILRDKHIPFRVDQNGKSISIPPESVYELRLELAGMGMPQTSIVGYEVFDKQSLGATSFIQKLNQKRAQEGELIRTINTIHGVRRSRVHLALPQKSAFLDDQKKATASVVVDLEPGVTLAEKQIYGIATLVSRATEGLDVADVVIMNADGKILSKNTSDPLSAATAGQLDFQGKYQSDLEHRIEEMLSRVVGEGRVVAKVNADLDFSQTNETQTSYDQDGSAVRSIEKRSDSMNGTRPTAGGSAGSASNTPGQTAAQKNEIKSETSRNNEITNYEVPQTIRKTVRSVGAVRKLSVAVVVDGKSVKKIDKDGKMVTTNEPWTPEKIKEFELVVAGAVGLDRKRGDTLDIKNMEFTHEDFEEVQKFLTEKENKTYLENIVIYSVIGLAVILFFLLVVRPFIKWMVENTVDSVDTFLPQTVEELERLQKSSAMPSLEDIMPVLPESLDPNKVEGEMIKEKIITLVDSNPHKAALILRDWLHESPGKRLQEKAEMDSELSA